MGGPNFDWLLLVLSVLGVLLVIPAILLVILALGKRHHQPKDTSSRAKRRSRR